MQMIPCIQNTIQDCMLAKIWISSWKLFMNMHKDTLINNILKGAVYKGNPD